MASSTVYRRARANAAERYTLPSNLPTGVYPSQIRGMKNLFTALAVTLLSSPAMALPVIEGDSLGMCQRFQNSYSDYSKCLQDDYKRQFDRIREERKAQEAAPERRGAIPVGASGTRTPVGASDTRTYVNGREIHKCSHGDLCLFEMIDAMRGR